MIDGGGRTAQPENRVPTARDGQGLRYLSHLRDPSGREVTKAFALKQDAQRWLDERTAQLMHGTFVHPTSAKTTVGEWCESWLEGYGTRRKSRVGQAWVHTDRIVAYLVAPETVTERSKCRSALYQPS